MRIVLTTLPAQAAENLASTLVTERAAACVNIVPAITSVYRWNGVLEKAAESLLIVKTSDAAAPRLMDRIAALHPYETPEIAAFDASHVSASYLVWVDSETASPPQASQSAPPSVDVPDGARNVSAPRSVSASVRRREMAAKKKAAKKSAKKPAKKAKKAKK